MMDFKKHISNRFLRENLLLILCAFIVLSAIVFVWVTERKLEANIVNSFYEEQTNHAILVSDLLKTHMEDAHQNLFYMIEGLRKEEGLVAMKEFLDNFFAIHRDKFKSISMIDPEGNVLVNSGAFISDKRFFDYIDVEERETFSKNLDSFISERIIRHEGSPSTFLFVPFSMSTIGPGVYYIVGELSLKDFINKRLQYIYNKEVYFVMADNNGDIFGIINVNHDDIDQMERGNLYNLSYNCRKCHSPDSFEFFNEADQPKKPTHSLYESPTGELYYRTVAMIPVYNEKWLVSIAQPHSRIQGQISYTFRTNAIVILLLLISAVLGAYAFYRVNHRMAMESQYHDLVNSLEVGIVRLGKSGEILSMNAAMEYLLGLPPDTSTKNMSINEFFRHKSDWQSIITSISDTGKINENEFWLTKQNENDDFIASFSMHAVTDKMGEIIHIDGVIQDITDKKRAEEERLKISRLDSIELMAGGIAHDFNNLLTAIAGHISISRIVKDRKKQELALKKAEDASYRAQGLTQQLLTFSKGGSPVQAPGSIEKVIRENVQFVLHGTKSKVKFDFPPDLKLVDIDAEQIEQVIQNLAINADQAMPGGGTINIGAQNIVISKHKNLKPGEYVMVSVEDSGRGMTPDVLSRIFDPYYTTKATGSGLGLAVCASVIHKHGGTIYADSAPGRGTTFVFYLPVSEIKRRTAHDRQADIIVYGTGKILIIDDDPTVGDTMESFLEELGYEPHFITNGEEALRLLKDANSSFDAVITDLTIPGGMGGIEIKDAILEILPDMKIIVVSGYSDDPVMKMHREYGFDGMIKKPFRINVVAKVLHEILRS